MKKQNDKPGRQSGAIKQTEPSKVLVVGDWVIDDYWLTGTHRSPTASRVGSSQLRALNSPNGLVSLLAGAARVASLLHSATNNGNPVCSVIGLGQWHPDDDNHLRAMTFSSDAVKGWTPSRISRPLPHQPDDHSVELLNIANLLKADDRNHGQTLKADGGNQRQSREYGTIRVVRILQQTGSDLQLRERIDWEVPPQDREEEQPAWITEDTLPTFNDNIKSRFKNNKDYTEKKFDLKDITAIVIKDLGKGVVSDHLVEWLVGECPNAKWFISTKLFAPKWLRHLESREVLIYLIPQLAAQDAIQQGIVYSWFAKSARLPEPKPTQEALQAIDRIFEKLPGQKNLRVIALPEGYSVLARDSSGNGFCQPNREPVPFYENAAMASACFPCLVASLLHEPNISFEKLISSALRYTYKFNDQEASWFKNPAIPTDPDIKIELSSGEFGKTDFNFRFDKDDWLNWNAEWGQASKPLGIIRKSASFSITEQSLEDLKSEGAPDDVLEKLEPIKNLVIKEKGLFLDLLKHTVGDALTENLKSLILEFAQKPVLELNETPGHIEPNLMADEAPSHINPNHETGNPPGRIELWRAMTEIDGYACYVPSKRKRLAELVNEIRAFTHDPQQNVSGILIAKPGSGKTSLVRALSKTVKMQFLDFNITQMVSRDDLIACFDTILTTQAQNREQPVLVFFDEINALLYNQHVYDVFLSPLEDGVYLRSGKKYYIQPCVWIFASTARPTKSSALLHDESIKASDFESRLTMEDIDLTARGDVGEHIETIYRGVAMIQNTFPDVRQVSRAMLEMLFHLSLDVPPRELRQVIKSFRNVQYGRVSTRNVPQKWLQKFRKPHSNIGRAADAAVGSYPDIEWIDII